ncbi:winged helix-turn-helix transcriptional regulator [Rhodobium gokarnense]|uniref:DNA-binding HxlR family transcriptional regulator n=1 Tax=Rhodobium gokarnense TaxID=364296 RepID=A0ABT3HAY0_9HYPH|nr:helix-turn-helix domain-containing protein [Rhodobium gokarnense]MCW2307558.1 DNA-binding HxlR family transcriptional regulator [Rhodobium gokarnense]
MADIIEHHSPFICGLDAALRVVGGKWKPLILFFLAKGSMRYGALKRAVKGVSDKVLIQQLKELEAHGIIARTDYKEIPPRVDYRLTPLGKTLAEALRPLCVWGDENTRAIAAIIEP